MTSVVLAWRSTHRGACGSRSTSTHSSLYWLSRPQSRTARSTRCHCHPVRPGPTRSISSHAKVPRVRGREPLGASPDAKDLIREDDPRVARSILIVDDHAGFRSWARALLEMQGYAVVGEAEDGGSAIAA